MAETPTEKAFRSIERLIQNMREIEEAKNHWLGLIDAAGPVNSTDERITRP